MKQLTLFAAVAAVAFAGLVTNTAPAGITLAEKVIEQIDDPVSETKCYPVAYERVQKAASVVPCATTFPPKSGRFWRIWRSAVGTDAGWTNIPAHYRGAGPAGAMASEGWGTLVQAKDVWEGKLIPGAVVQIWPTPAIYEKVKRGEPLQEGPPHNEYGHAFIFVKYSKDNAGKITGMHIADQGTDWSKRVVKKEVWDVWIGANIKCK